MPCDPAILAAFGAQLARPASPHAAGAPQFGLQN